MIMINKGLIFFFLFYGTLHCHAQQLWTGTTVRLKLPKNFTLEAEQQTRFREQTYDYHSTYLEATMAYKFNDHLAVKGGYRYTFIEENNRYIFIEGNSRQRFNGDINYNIGSGKTKVSLNFRTRYQKTIKMASDKELDYVRQNIELEYNLTKKARPYFSVEPFYRLNKINEIRAIRYTMGLTSEITKQLSVNPFYRFEKEINVEESEKMYIIGLMLSYKIKFKE